MQKLATGMRVRLNTPTINGNMGPGTVVHVEGYGDGPADLVGIHFDGKPYRPGRWTDCLRDQLTMIRSQRSAGRAAAPRR